MKQIISSIALLIGGVLLQAQIKNPGFEVIENGQATDWKYNAQAPFHIKIDNSTKYSGSNSLLISSETTQPNNTQTFSQRVAIPWKGLRLIELNAYIKSENTNGNIIFWNQVRKDEKTMLDFANSNMQDKVNINTDWKKYTLKFTLDDDAKYFLVGGLLNGNGRVWFDDFSMTEIPFSTVASSKEALQYIDEFKDIVKKNSIFKEKNKLENYRRKSSEVIYEYANCR